MLGMIVAVVVPMGRDLTAEAYLNHILVTGDQPALGGGAPVVGHLDLLAVFKALLENTQLVADRIAGSLQTLGGHGVHIARGETAETAVAETGVGFFLKDIGSAAAHVLQGADDRLGQAEVVGVLHQAAPHEELHRHIVYFLLGLAGILRGEKSAHQLADDNGSGLKDLLVRRLGVGGAELGTELVFDGAADFFAGNLIFHENTCLF